MIEHSKIIRELSILLYLSEDGGHTIEETAARFQLNSRSVYRYITTFKEVGFLVYKKGKRFFVGKESAFFKEISQLAYFSDEEAYLINQLIDNLDISCWTEEILESFSLILVEDEFEAVFL